MNETVFVAVAYGLIGFCAGAVTICCIWARHDNKRDERAAQEEETTT